MKASFAEKLCCPFDKHSLDLRIFLTDTNGDLIEGILTCRACSRYYPIVYGIPIMTPDEYREKTLEEPILKKWGMKIEKTDAKSFLLPK